MPFTERRQAIRRLEELRGTRVLTLINSDRTVFPQQVPIPGYSSNLTPDAKPYLFEALSQIGRVPKLDLFLYTRGGDINAVWPIVSLLREFCDQLSVLVPFRGHSAGTLIAFGANRIVMGPMAELSPIDPQTGNMFNPVDEAVPGSGQRVRLGISVEDVAAYFDLAKETMAGRHRGGDHSRPARELSAVEAQSAWNMAFARLSETVHPLALGNVERVHKQIRELASKLLALHISEESRISKIVDYFTEKFYSHVHAINRAEAQKHLESVVERPSPEQEAAIWALYRAYDADLHFTEPFSVTQWLGNEAVREDRPICAMIESLNASFAFVTHLRITQVTGFPPGVQVQLQPGQPMPLLPGMPRQVNVDALSSRWQANVEER